MGSFFNNRKRALRWRRLYVRAVRTVWRFATAHQEFILALALGLLAAALLAPLPAVGPLLAVLSLAAGAVVGWLHELRLGFRGLFACETKG